MLLVKQYIKHLISFSKNNSINFALGKKQPVGQHSVRNVNDGQERVETPISGTSGLTFSDRYSLPIDPMIWRTHERLNLSVMNLADVNVPRFSSTRIDRTAVKPIPLPGNNIQVEEIICAVSIVKTEDPTDIGSSIGLTGEINDVGQSQEINFETSSQLAKETNIEAINGHSRADILLTLLTKTFNVLKKRETCCVAILLIVTYIIGFMIDDHSMYFATWRLGCLLPLFWIRNSDEITDYTVKKLTNFIQKFV